MNQKTILIDIDDTIIELINPWIKAINKKYNINLKLNKLTTWDLTLSFPELANKDYCSILGEEDFWKTIKPKKDAVKYVKKLIDDGYIIYLCSASDYRTINYKMSHAVFKHFPFIHWKNVIICNDKQIINADYLIDDGIHNLLGGNYEKILLTSPVNKSINEKLYNITRCNSWKDIYEYISKGVN